jgi:hypothetical protein
MAFYFSLERRNQMKINVLGIIKGVSELIVSTGAGVVVGNLVKATTPYDLGKVQKVMVGVGGYAIGAVLGDLSAKYVSSQIDGYAERINEIIHPSEETQEAAVEAAEAVITDIQKPKKEDKSDNSE